MKKIIPNIFLFLIFFSSCQKRKCKEAQQKEMVALIARYQQQISITGLTAQQIQELTVRFKNDEAKILAECN